MYVAVARHHLAVNMVRAAFKLDLGCAIRESLRGIYGARRHEGTSVMQEYLNSLTTPGGMN